MYIAQYIHVNYSGLDSFQQNYFRNVTFCNFYESVKVKMQIQDSLLLLLV